jgi:AcrR family transcriptional regulator
MAASNRRTEYAELTKSAVLDAAAQQFVQHGYSASTIDDVARSARVSKGAVYYHFANKAELFEAVFRDRQLALTGAVAAATSQESGPWEQLRTGLDAFVSGSVADPVHRSLLQQAPSALGPERCKEIDQEIGLPLLEQALRNIEAHGQLIEHPIGLLARMLFSTLCEAAMVAGADPDPATASAHVATILRAMTHGLRTDQKS